MNRTCVFVFSFLLLLIYTNCSTAPKKTVVITDKANQAADYAKLGDGFFAEGSYDNALKFYDQSLQVNMSIDNLEGIVISYNSIGRVFMQAGNIESAEKSFSNALKYAELSKFEDVKASTFINLGELAYAKNDREKAENYFIQAENFVKANQRTRAILDHDKAVILRDKDQLENAVSLINQAITINTKLKAWTELSSNFYLLATIESKRENWIKALEYGEKALEVDKKAEFSRGIADDLEIIALCKLKTGFQLESYNYYIRAFNVYLSTNNISGVKRSLQSIVKLATEIGDEAGFAEYTEKLQKLDSF